MIQIETPTHPHTDIKLATLDIYQNETKTKEHVLAVVNNVTALAQQLKCNKSTIKVLQEAAYGHDLIEDKKLSPLDLKNLGFSEEAIHLIMLMSKDRDYGSQKIAHLPWNNGSTPSLYQAYNALSIEAQSEFSPTSEFHQKTIQQWIAIEKILAEPDQKIRNRALLLKLADRLANIDMDQEALKNFSQQSEEKINFRQYYTAATLCIHLPIFEKCFPPKLLTTFKQTLNYNSEQLIKHHYPPPINEYRSLINAFRHFKHGAQTHFSNHNHK